MAVTHAKINEFTVSPPGGTPVWYYEFADLNSEPKGAWVVESGLRGIIGLIILDKYGGTNVYKSSVYHASTPALWDKLGQPTQNALRNGAWDYHPWFKPPLDCPVPAPKPPAPGTVTKQSISAYQEKERKVLEVAEEFDNVDDVFHRVKFLGLSRVDVENIFVKHNKMAPPPAVTEDGIVQELVGATA